MIDVLREELRELLDRRRDQLQEICSMRGVNDRVDELTLVCRKVVRSSSLCYVDGEMCYFDGRSYVPVGSAPVATVLGDLLVDMCASPTDVRRMGSMPLSVVLERSYSSQSKLCFENGVLDLDRNSFRRGFSPEWIVTERMPYAYSPGAEYPLWEKFLSEVLPDESVRMVLQEFCGMVYMDRKNFSVEKFALFVGAGANGKSVIFEVLKRVIGPDNVSTLDCAQLTKENMIPYASGKRLNFSPDVRKSAEFDSALKALASGQDVTGRKIYGEAEKIKCPPLIFALNEMPRFRDTTQAFFRRILLFSFDIQIPPKNQDRGLVGKICASDMPGIFNWMIEGRDRLIANGGEFTRSKRMDLDLEKLKNDVSAATYPVRNYLMGRGLDVYPAYDGQAYTPISQNEIHSALRGIVSRNAITREMRDFGVFVHRSKEMYYHVFERG